MLLARGRRVREDRLQRFRRREGPERFIAHVVGVRLAPPCAGRQQDQSKDCEQGYEFFHGTSSFLNSFGILVCRGGDSRARRRTCSAYKPSLKWNRLPSLSLRGPEGAVAISGRQLRFRRECLVIRPYSARFPRRDAPRNDKLGSLAPMNLCRDHCRPAWRSGSAATDAIGFYVFIGNRHES